MSLEYRSTGFVCAEALFCVGLLTLSPVLAGQALEQFPESPQIVGCRQIAEEASRNLHRMTSKSARQLGGDKESHRGAQDDLFNAVRDSDTLKKYLQCLSAQRAIERK